MERHVVPSRACGKVILLGEHAVVHGIPALAVGIDLGARAIARAADDGASAISIGGPRWRTEVASGPETDRAFAALREASGERSPVRVEAWTDLWPGAGLGCSAALGVAVARAIDARRGAAAGPDEIAARAGAWERVFHGNPSGVDAAVAARGGCIEFARSPTGPQVADIAVGLPLVLAVGHSGRASSTREMVGRVAALRDRRPELVRSTFGEIAGAVRSARRALEGGDPAALGAAMDRNQALLGDLGLSTDAIEGMCALARAAGAHGAKLTGAGGGGCVVALARADGEARVLDAWRGAGFDGFATSVGGRR